MKTIIVPISPTDRVKVIGFNKSIRIINSYRISESIPTFPRFLLKVKQKLIYPRCCKALSEHVDDFVAYREGMRIMSVELDIIEMIHSGNIPSMNPVERDRLRTDLNQINETRENEDGFELDLDMTLHQHFYKDTP